MSIALAIGLTGGVWMEMNMFAGVVCDLDDAVCRYMRIDGRVFELGED